MKLFMNQSEVSALPIGCLFLVDVSYSPTECLGPQMIIYIFWYISGRRTSCVPGRRTVGGVSPVGEGTTVPDPDEARQSSPNIATRPNQPRGESRSGYRNDGTYF